MTCPRSLCQWKHDSGSGPSASEVPEIRSLLSLLLPLEEARCRGGLFWSAPAGHGHAGPWGGGGQSSRRPQSAPTREGQGERPATKRLRKSGCSGGVIQASARCQLGSDSLGVNLHFYLFSQRLFQRPGLPVKPQGSLILHVPSGQRSPAHDVAASRCGTRRRQKSSALAAHTAAGLANNPLHFRGELSTLKG